MKSAHAQKALVFIIVSYILYRLNIQLHYHFVLYKITFSDDNYYKLHLISICKKLSAHM